MDLADFDLMTIIKDKKKYNSHFTEREILEIYKNGIKRASPLVEKIDQISLSGIADSTLILKARKEYSEMVRKIYGIHFTEQAI